MYIHPLYHWPNKGSWGDIATGTRNWDDFAAYVHYPFCREICDFCGYETRLISKPATAKFAQSVASQVMAYKISDNFDNSNLTSLFFGGGTASLMPVSELRSIVAALTELSRSEQTPEITLECEPGTMSSARLREAVECGVNRISVCAQSFSDEELSRLGRKHNSVQSIELIERALAVGITNIHVDLIYGLPEQSEADWIETVKFTTTLPITHISAYKLYVYKYGALDRQGLAPRSELETAENTGSLRRMSENGAALLEEAGFNQYTLTEFSQKGFKSDYLTKTFGGGDILPVGPSAFGRCKNRIWDNAPYVHLFGSPSAVRFDRVRQLSDIEAFKRDTILGLWLLTVDLDQLAKRHGVVVGGGLKDLLVELADEGLIGYVDSTVSLGVKQRFLAGVVMERLAKLVTEDWGDVRSTGGPKQVSRAAAQISTNLSAVLRMARREPDFFRQLGSADSEATLQLLTDLGDFDRRRLRSAIADSCVEALTPSDDEVVLAWRRIAEEHREVNVRGGGRSI
jgi:oxygen-independent coproporphyrinogen-3 oxidase